MADNNQATIRVVTNFPPGPQCSHDVVFNAINFSQLIRGDHGKKIIIKWSLALEK